MRRHKRYKNCGPYRAICYLTLMICPLLDVDMTKVAIYVIVAIGGKMIFDLVKIAGER
ncbi:MAG: hypothetical protein ABID54_06325 [Pseudomonadota bacterium]